MKRNSILPIVCLAFVTTVTVGSLLAARPVAAQTPAIGFQPGALGVEDNAADTGVSSYSLGFEFTAKAPITVTSLGYFNDPSFDPQNPFRLGVPLSPTSGGTYAYSQNHLVGLYQVVPGVNGSPEAGLLLTQATVTSAGMSVGDFLYTTLPGGGVTLTAGTRYVLAGVTGSDDPYVYDVQDSSGNAALTTDSAISYVQNRYAVSSSLVFPGSTDGGSEPGFFGPNFLSGPAPAAVPEPSALAAFLLGGLGLAGLGLTARRRSRSH